MTSQASPGRAFYLALFTAALIFLLPAGITGWLSWFGGLARTIVAPISQPMAKVSRWLKPTGLIASPDGIAAIEEEREQFRTLYLRESEENRRLRGLLDELRTLSVIDGTERTRQIMAPVVASGSDLSPGLMVVRAGSRLGVAVGDIAAGTGLQLIGRVVSTDALTSTVEIITEADEQILGVVMPDGTADGLPCRLQPEGDGTLRGPVEDRRVSMSDKPIEPEVGQPVRLRDPDRWPRAAQMLIIGTIERIEPAPNQPLRKIITVRPTIPDMARVQSVLLRISERGTEVPAPTGGGT